MFNIYKRILYNPQPSSERDLEKDSSFSSILFFHYIYVNSYF